MDVHASDQRKLEDWADSMHGTKGNLATANNESPSKIDEEVRT